jgi:hypothetical protein
VPDPHLVAFLHPLGRLDAPPVQPGAVGRTQVLDIPAAVGDLKARVEAGGELVVDGQIALAADREVGIDAAARQAACSCSVMPSQAGNGVG